MKYKIIFILLLIIASLNYSEEKKSHFFDIYNNSLDQYDFIFDELKKYFDDKVPEKIIVKYITGNASQFDYINDIVKITEYHANFDSVRTIAHESCHICMAHFTNNASVIEIFRFFDEGFANIFGNMAINKLEDYKKESLSIAAIQNNKNNVSFDKIEEWSKYFGDPNTHTNFYAYPVGSSFDFYIIDTYGMYNLFLFFKDIGKTYDLEKSFKNIFNKNKLEIENEWKHYLSKVEVPNKPPQIVKMYPENNANNVSIEINEIYIEFDTSMINNIILITNCNAGICYKDAYWKSDKILAIKVNLLTNYNYNLLLGDEIHGKFMSKEGLDLPITLWTFKTGLKNNKLDSLQTLFKENTTNKVLYNLNKGFNKNEKCARRLTADISSATFSVAPGQRFESLFV